MQIQNEREILAYLDIPSLPRKEWDGKKSFKDGVAITTLSDGGKAYAVATFDADTDVRVRIKKVFTLQPFSEIEKVLVVPSYMDMDVDNFDLVDERSRAAAKALVAEAKELENAGVIEDSSVPSNEYCFDNIHSDEEAVAFIRSYNKQNKIKGSVPTNHETIVLRLATIYADVQNASNKKKSKRKRK